MRNIRKPKVSFLSERTETTNVCVQRAYAAVMPSSVSRCVCVRACLRACLRACVRAQKSNNDYTAIFVLDKTVSKVKYTCKKINIQLGLWSISIKRNSVRFHNSHNKDNHALSHNGNSWHQSILQSVLVSFMRTKHLFEPMHLMEIAGLNVLAQHSCAQISSIINNVIKLMQFD